MVASSSLPDTPQGWLDRYETMETVGWRIRVDRTLLTDEAKGYLMSPHRFFDDAVVAWFKRGRNRLAEVRWPGAEGGPTATVVLKEYGSSGVIGTLRGMLRPPRATRAWQQAFAILERGFLTPRPLYLALPGERARKRSYLAVETAPPHTRLREILKQMKSKGGKIALGGGLTLEIDPFLRILAGYVRRMHDAGIWHRDFSGGNLLIPNDWRPAADDSPQTFVLIDVNRARLFPPGSLTLSHRMQDLERISLPDPLRAPFYEAYSANDPALSAARELYLRSARRYRKLRETRNPVARLLRRVFTYWLRFP